jgi:D-glycero-D-manno-heptose 1,7-bisphosphate phosphatase
VFLDRDGILNELVVDPHSLKPESPLHVEDVRLLPGVTAAIGLLTRAGYVLVGVTNQPAAAKGTVALEELLRVHERVVSLLAADGAALDDWRVCLHHPEGIVPELTTDCSCRKPKPGLLLDAARGMNLDLGASWMIGDTDADVGAGLAAGCRTILVEHPESSHKRTGDALADYRVAELLEAVALITSGIASAR